MRQPFLINIRLLRGFSTKKNYTQLEQLDVINELTHIQLYNLN